MKRREFLAMLVLGVLASTVLSGCQDEWNPFKPRSDHGGWIVNTTQYTMCEVVIDGFATTNLAPGESRKWRKRLEGGVKHSFYARTDDPDVFNRSFSHAVDDEDDRVYGDDRKVGWIWYIGGAFHP